MTQVALQYPLSEGANTFKRLAISSLQGLEKIAGIGFDVEAYKVEGGFAVVIEDLPTDDLEPSYLRRLRRSDWRISSHTSLLRVYQFKVLPEEPGNPIVWRPLPCVGLKDSASAWGDGAQSEDSPYRDRTALAYSGDVFVGYVAFGGLDETCIDYLWVDPKYRRRGYGRWIVQDVEAAVTLIHGGATVIPANADTIDNPTFWKRVGWSVAGQFGVGNHRACSRNLDFLLSAMTTPRGV